MRPASPLEVVGGAAQERLHAYRVLHREMIDERHGHLVRPGRHFHAHPHPRLHRAAGVGGLLEQLHQVRGPANGDVVHGLAVDRHFELARVLETADHVQVGAIELGLKVVFAVERKEVAHAQAAHGAERQPLDVLVLRQILRHAIGVAAGAQGGIAHGHGADAGRRREVALLQRGRHAEHVGDVVEAEGGIVGRQQRGHVHVERQQVADGVAVLGPVEAMQHRPARVGPRDGAAIETVLDVGDERLQRLRVGAPDALRRHDAGADLPHHLLPDVGVLGQPREVQAVEGQAAGLEARVVAGDAVPIDQGLVRGRRGGRRWASCRGARGRATPCLSGGQGGGGTPKHGGDGERGVSHGLRQNPILLNMPDSAPSDPPLTGIYRSRITLHGRGFAPLFLERAHAGRPDRAP